MPFAMSTVGQGSTSYIAAPTWNATGATEATGGYYIRIKFKVESLAAVNHLVGSSSATNGSLRTTTAGALLYRNNTADLITSSAGAIVAGQVHEAILRRIYTPSAAIQLELDGSIVNTTPTTTLGWLTSVNQLARFSTSARSDITVYEFEVFNGASSYSAVWDDTGASGSGTTWADDTATRNLTITNATGATDSWWLNYGSSIDFASNSRSTSLSESALTTAINFASMSYSTSASTSDIVAGAINFASMSYSTSLAFSEMATQIQMQSISVSSSTSISLLSDNSASISFSSESHSESRSVSQIQTQIHFSSFSSSVSNSFSQMQDVGAIPKRYVKRSNGLQFVQYPLKRFGEEFKQYHLKRWDGKKWVKYNG